MDPVLLFIFYRMLIVVGGILCIYFGYRLFYIAKTKQGDFKIKTGQNYELSLSDVAPGIFFALFGAGVLVFSLTNGVTIKPGTSVSNMPSKFEISNLSPQLVNPQNNAVPGVNSGNANAHLPCLSQRPGEC